MLHRSKKPIHGIVLGLLLLAVAGCKETAEDAPAYYERATQFLAQDQHELALVEVKGALKLDPRLQPALELRLELHEQQADYAAVIETIKRLLEVDPTHLEATLRKAELLLLAGETEASKEPIEQALDLAPENPKAQNLKAAWLMRNGQLPEALDYSDQARAKPPTSAETYALAIIIRLQMQRLAEAKVLINTALAEHPKHAAIHLLRISIAHSEGRFSEVPGYYDTLIDLYPNEIAYPRELALFHLRTDNDALAIAAMQKMVDTNPNNIDARFLLGQLLARDRSPESFSQIEGLLAEQPKTTQLRFLLARLYEDSEQYSNAISHYETVAKLDPNEPEALNARAELARIALNQGNRETANLQINALLKQDPSHTAGLLLQAHMLLLDEQFAEAIIVLRSLLRNTPTDDRALELIGRAYLLNNSRAIAIDSFRSSLQANPLNKLAAKQLATLYMQDGDLTGTANVLTPFEAAQVGDADIERALLQARLMLKDWRGAQRLADSSQIGRNNPLFKKLISALVLQGNQKFGASIPLLKDIFAAEGGNTRTVLMALMTGFEGANQLDDGVRFFEQYRNQHPDKSWSDQLLFDMYIRADQRKAASRLLEQQISSEQTNPKAFGLLAGLQDAGGRTDTALETLDLGIKRFPDSMPLYLAKASLLERLDQIPKAVTTYQAILKRSPNTGLAANNLAVIYSRDPDKLMEARELADRFRGTRQPYFADTLGWICTLTDDLDCAIPLLELAVRRLPEQAEFNYHLGAALTKAKQQVKARQHLEKAVSLLDAGATFVGSNALFVLLDKLDS